MKKFIVGLFIVLILIAIGLGAIYFFKLKEETSEFYVELPNGATCESSVSLHLPKGNSYTFKVSKEFNLNVLPNVENPENNFTFSVEGASKQFFAELNLQNGFNLEIKENEFTLTLAPEENVKSVLEKIYEGKTVNVPEDKVNSVALLFSFYVSDKENENLYIINFAIMNELLVTLPGEIVF